MVECHVSVGFVAVISHQPHAYHLATKGQRAESQGSSLDSQSLAQMPHPSITHTHTHTHTHPLTNATPTTHTHTSVVLAVGLLMTLSWTTRAILSIYSQF